MKQKQRNKNIETLFRLLLIFIFIIGFAKNIHADLSDNLIAYYSFDSDATDIHNNYDLTVNGASATGSCKLSSCYNYDGTDDYLIKQNLTLNSSSYSINIWAKSDVNQANSDYNLIWRWGSPANQNSHLYFSGYGTNQLLNRVLNEEQTDYVTSQKYNTISMGTTWHMYTTVIDNTAGNVKLYIDGTLTNTTTIVGTLAQKKGDFVIGSRSPTLGAHEPFDGLIDETGIWYKALTATEVTNLYNSGAGLPYSQFVANISYLTITAKDNKTSGVITSFNITVTQKGNNISYYNTSSATILTDIPINSSNYVNITFWGNKNYQNRTYTNYQLSTNLQAVLYPFFQVFVYNSTPSYIPYSIFFNGIQTDRTAGKYITSLLFNQGFRNITISSTGFYNRTYTNYNISTNLNTTLYKTSVVNVSKPVSGNYTRFINTTWSITKDPTHTILYKNISLIANNGSKYNIRDTMFNISDTTASGDFTNDNYFKDGNDVTYANWSQSGSDSTINKYIAIDFASSKYIDNITLKYDYGASYNSGSIQCLVKLYVKNTTNQYEFYTVLYNQSYPDTGGVVTCTQNYNSNVKLPIGKKINGYYLAFQTYYAGGNTPSANFKAYSTALLYKENQLYFDSFFENVNTGLYRMLVESKNSNNNTFYDYSDYFNITKNSLINISAYDLISNVAINNFNISLIDRDLSSEINYTTATGSLLLYLVQGRNYTFRIDNPDFQIKEYNFTASQSFNGYQFKIYTTNSVNFTFYDEETGNLLSGVSITLVGLSELFSFNITTADGTAYEDLLSPTSYTLIFSADGYATKYYYLNLDNRTHTDLDLYLINSSRADLITFYVYNQNTLSRQQDVYIKVLKYFADEVAYKTVQISKTNFQGQTTAYLRKNDAFYKFILEYPLGTVVLTSDPTLVTDDIIYFYFSEYNSQLITLLSQYQGINYQLTFNNNTNNFRFVWDNDYEYDFCLKVYDTTSTSNLINTTCVTSQAGTILIPVNNISGYTYEAKAYFSKNNGETYLFLSSKYADFRNDIFKNNKIGMFLNTFLTMALMFVGYWNPSFMLLMLPLPSVILSIIGIIHMPLTTIIPLYIIVFIFVFWFNNKT